MYIMFEFTHQMLHVTPEWETFFEQSMDNMTGLLTRQTKSLKKLKIAVQIRLW